MNQNEEEVQKKFENGNPEGNDLDTAAYREVFRALGKAPSHSLRADFSDSVLTKILAKQQKESARDMWWLGFGIVFLFVGFVLTVAVAGMNLEFGFFRQIAPYAGLIVFGAVFMIALNWIDKRVVTRKDLSL